jgi:L-amino acid N-acyltransferase YncA
VKEDLAIRIRTASPKDADDILAIYAPYIARTAISFEEQPPSVDEMASRIENSHLWLVAEEDSRITGFAYATRFHPRPAYRWSTEVSIYLADGARGRGLGSRLLRELLDGLRARGFVNAFAGTTLPNPASVALFESFGFEKVAHQRKVGFKLGAWHDVGWWQLHLRDPRAPPPSIS